MKCPHCLVAYQPIEHLVNLARDEAQMWKAVVRQCPACDRFNFSLRTYDLTCDERGEWIFFPESTGREPCPAEVTDKALRSDYEEACAVLKASPKASAALSRRCLQHMLQTHAGAKGKNLYEEIEWVVENGDVPSYLKDELHTVREYGNLAAHTSKDINTGEIVSVEDGEAEGLLDVIEGLFDHFFVARKKAEERQAKLAETLAKIGRKTTPRT